MNQTPETTTSHAGQTIAAPAATPVGGVQIFGAVLVGSRATRFVRTVAAHAPTPSRSAADAGFDGPDESTWLELERVLQARAASMAAHPTAHAIAPPSARPAGLRLAS